MRLVVKGEEDALAEFLRAHLQTSMFLLSNLLDHGLDGDHPHTTAFYCAPDDGPIRAVFGRNRRGMVMCQAPDLLAQDAADYAAAIAGQPIWGYVGEADQGALLLQALGLTPPHDVVEPLYRLDLADLGGALPQGAQVRPPAPGDRALLLRWFEDYVVETELKDAGAPAREDALRRTDDALASGPQRLLIIDGVAIGMAALNAKADDHVQVGGVYVPPAHRNRGYGRAVTHAVLHEARSFGARVAILFANNPAAARAYEAIGFRHIGAFRISLMDRLEAPA